MTPQIHRVLMGLLMTVAEQTTYLEDLSVHTDAIFWHLNKIEMSEFQSYLDNYLISMLKQFKNKNLPSVSIAFDETYIPFYGKPNTFWIHGYNNKVKGATGSYKFMVCSIISRNKRYVLYAKPMYQGERTEKVLDDAITMIKKFLRISLILCDRGFFSAKIVNQLEKHDKGYLILTPKNKKIKRFLEAKELVVNDSLEFDKNKTRYKQDARYVFAYDIRGHDWVFTTNIQGDPRILVELYRCRWGIETNFRVMDHANIKSKSKNIVIRTFLFLISIVTFNSWLEESYGLTFERYLDKLALAHKNINQLVNEAIEAKRIFDIELTSEEKEIALSC